MKRSVISTGILLLLLAMTGCEQYATYTPTAIELTMIAEQYDGADKEIVQATAMARYLAAEASRAEAEQAAAIAGQAQATSAAASAAQAHQIMMLTVEAQQTVDARNLQATQQAWSATATADVMSFEATAAAQAIEATATAQAMAIQATATERAWIATVTQETANQQATATQETANQQATATQQATEREGTSTAIAATQRVEATQESQQATASVGHATMTRQAEKREAVLGYGRDYGIPLVLLAIACGIGALVYYGLGEYKKRPVVWQRNFLGDAQPMAIPLIGGGFTVVDVDRQPGPAITIRPDGSVDAPQLRSTGQEERTTARDQMVDAATRPQVGAGHKDNNAQSIALSPPPTPPAPGLQSVRLLRRLDQAAKGGLISDSLLASMAADWETEPGEEL